VKPLVEIYFLIHGFCYAGAEKGPPRAQRYFARESVCVKRWYARLEAFPENAALAIIPAGRTGPAAAYYAAASLALGDRFFMLDAPDCHAEEFWSAGDPDGSLLSEIRAALVYQRMAWNKEELYDALHAHACCRKLRAMLQERDFHFDRGTVRTEVWGESFDGCVTKYSLNLRRMLGLSEVVRIEFDLTVPDAFFLLDAALRDCVLLDGGVRLFLFEHESQFVGLYTMTEHSLANEPAYVTLPAEPGTFTVKSKQGIRLWPQPEEYVLRNVPEGYGEPPQVVVTHAADGLRIPVSAGVVYRLAKAPAYVFVPREMSYADARSILTSARLQGYGGVTS